jgi:CRISPR-associated protein Cas2
MARSRLLVAYDVASDSRRAAVFKLLNDFGDWVQFSVFLCEVSDREEVELRSRLTQTIHVQEDSVVLVALGPSSSDIGQRLETLGKPRVLKERTLVV